MKTLIHPATPEVVEYVDDFTQERFDSFGPPVTISIVCGYGSKRDLLKYEFHADDIFLDKLMLFVKSQLPMKDKVENHIVENMALREAFEEDKT